MAYTYDYRIETTDIVFTGTIQTSDPVTSEGDVLDVIDKLVENLDIVFPIKFVVLTFIPKENMH